MSEIKDPKLEELIQVICWKLYLEPDLSQLADKWREFENSSDFKTKIQQISLSLANIAQRVFNYRLGVSTSVTEEEKKIEQLWQSFLTWSLDNPQQTSLEEIKKWHEIVNHEFKETVQNAISQVLYPPKVELPNFPKQNSQQLAQSAKKNQQSESDKNNRLYELNRKDTSISEPRIVNSSNIPEPAKDKLVSNTYPDLSDKETTDNTLNQTSEETTIKIPTQHSPSSEGEYTASSSQAESKFVKPQWRYLPLPENQPDKHEEFDFRGDRSPEGLKLIGARVRGKGHKQEGTNCDDWFEFSVIGNWTIIAVSDGAGSKKFSRVGAKASCQAAVKQLIDELKSHNLYARRIPEELSNDLKRSDNWDFVGQDINLVQNALHKAMNVAYQEVDKEANERQKYTDYYKALGNRDLDIKDLSATLLLAVHTTVAVGENNYNIVLTCQVGDGMLAAISQENKLQLLGKPDTGEHGGQTEFLTSKKVLEKNNLLQKTSVFPGKLKALMVMTDGVADDYFPNDPGMLELYGDLIFNQVINLSQSDNSEIARQLQNTQLPSIDHVESVRAKFQEKIERVLPDESQEPKTVSINSIANYANELGKSIPEVVASNALLAAGVMNEQMSQFTRNMKPEEKLKIWLDSYYRRGSFDDRTLVVLYQEEI